MYFYIFSLIGGTVVKNPTVNAGDTREADLISGLRRPPGVALTAPVMLSEKFHGQTSRWATVHGATGSQTQLSTHTPFLVWKFYFSSIMVP